MTTPAIIIICSAVCVILTLHQICAFQVPAKRLRGSELQKFRIPRASKLRSYMNDSVDPCFDFYEFACGNWPSFRPASETTPLTSPMKDLEDEVNKELQLLLEEGVNRNDGLVGRRVKDFYASCLDTVNASETVKQVFIEFARKNSGMPAVDGRWDERNYNWLIQVSNLRKNYGMDILIGLNIKPDMQSRQDSRIYIGEASTLIPKGICKEHDFKNSLYEELQTEIADNMAYWFDLDKGEGSKLASDIIDFETNLCRGMSDEVGPDVLPNMTRMTLPEMNNKFPNIDFQYFVTTSLGQPIPQSVNWEHELYFHHLSKIMRTTSKRVLANYIMYRALAVITFPEEADKDMRASLCIEKCMKHFSKVVGEMYNRKNFLIETVEDVEQLWSKLRESFKADINSQDWIEETTRRQSIYKINGMQLKFANYMKDLLHNEYGTLKIEKSHFWENILSLLELDQKNEVKKLYNNGGAKASVGKEVEAFNINVGYSPMQNLIRMPLGILQPPVYHRTAPYSYKYGVLGFFIARELVHGFDEIGWNFDETTAMRLWWDLNSTLVYKERAQCFRDQYVAYAGEDSGLSAIELDEKIREIIADNGALNISFNAYLQWLQKTDEPHILYDETLSEVDYTNTQLFFIAFAQNFCTSTYSKEEPIGFFPWDVTNYLEKFQVNGLLWNMKEFSREFNCLPGTEMNPGDKCIIY